jgi:hypothetical protein
VLGCTRRRRTVRRAAVSVTGAAATAPAGPGTVTAWEPPGRPGPGVAAAACHESRSSPGRNSGARKSLRLVGGNLLPK